MIRIQNWAANFETHESRKLKRLDWVSIPNDLIDLQYRMLIDHPDGASHFGAWVAVVEIASTCKIRGTLAEGRVSMGPRHLALKSGLPCALFEAVIPRLLKINWLEEIPDSSEESTKAPEDCPGNPADCWEVAGKTSAYIDIDTYSDNNNNSKPSCASRDAHLIDSGPIPSIDSPPFDTTEPDALFPSGPPRLKKRPSGMTQEQEGWFTTWWSEYWLHKAKKTAREAFGKHIGTESRFRQVMEATRAQSAEMLSREPRHRLHGATWIRGERWADEVTPAVVARHGATSDPISRALGILESQGGK